MQVWFRKQTQAVKALPLAVLSEEESIALLNKHQRDLPSDNPEIGAIAAEPGGLHLALHGVGSFLVDYQNDVTIAAYLEQLRGPDLLQHPSLQGRGEIREVSPTLRGQHIGRTFAISYEKLKTADQIDQLALTILARAVCFVPGEG